MRVGRIHAVRRRIRQTYYQVRIYPYCWHLSGIALYLYLLTGILCERWKSGNAFPFPSSHYITNSLDRQREPLFSHSYLTVLFLPPAAAGRRGTSGDTPHPARGRLSPRSEEHTS